MRKTILLLFLTLVLSSSLAFAQNRNSVTGFVFDESRRPIPQQLYVELLNDLNVTFSRARIESSGMFSFRGLPNGNYYIRVLSSGTDYEEQTKSVSLIPVSAGRDPNGRESGAAFEQVDFYLKRRKNAASAATAPPAVIFAQEIPPAAKSLYESGVQALADKNNAIGLEKIKQSIEAFPDYFLALERLGTEYVMAGQYEAAHVLLSKALQINPKSFNSSFGKGLAEFRLGHTDLAIVSFRNSLELNKASPNGHLWLGIALHAKANFNDALKSLIKANELSEGTSAEVHWQLARVYKDQKNFPKAADELELFLKYKPDAHNVSEIKEIVSSLRKKT